MSKIHVEVDISQVANELDRLIKGPDFRGARALESLFVDALAWTEARIHVETGSLKSTAHLNTKYDKMQWQGTIRVGGAAPGMPRDPAYYGVYELARGGSHFFFDFNYEEIPPEIINIILEWMDAGDHGGGGVIRVPQVTPPSGAEVIAKEAASRAQNAEKERHRTEGRKTSFHTRKKSSPFFLNDGGIQYYE